MSNICYNNIMNTLEKNIIKTREMLDEYVARGGKLEDLKNSDKEYQAVCNLRLKDETGKSLSIEERFAFLGHKRPNQRQDFFKNAEAMVDKFVAEGGNVDDLTKAHPVYAYIVGTRIRKPDGTVMSVEEKFERIGHPRKPKKENPFVKGQRILDEFVAKGGNVDDLGCDDYEYNYIKNSKFILDGRRLDVEEVFILLGHPRKVKQVKDVRTTLIEEVKAYRASGGSFHVRRKDFPFFERLHTYVVSQHQKGINITTEQAMKSLGFREYSDVYYRCKDLVKLKNYRDAEGYVDSFRTNVQFKQYISDIAKGYGIPYSFVIFLLCDEKVRRFAISTEYISYVKSGLEDYILLNGSLDGISSRDPELYAKLDNVKKYFSIGNGDYFSNEDLLLVLELDGVKNRMTDSTKTDFDVDEIMLNLKKNGGKVTSKSLTNIEYRRIVAKSIKLGVPVQELFKSYGIDYHGNNTNRLSKVYVETLPFLQEMKKRRDEIISTVGLPVDACKEEIFEARLKACQQVYAEFKDKIYNFTPDDVKDKDKELGD